MTLAKTYKSLSFASAVKQKTKTSSNTIIMRFHLTLALILAAAQAVKIDSSVLAQVNASCEPNCEPSGDDFDPDTDHPVKMEIDVTKDVIADVAPIVEEALAEQGVKAALEAVTGADLTENLIDDVIIPCFEVTAAEELLNVDAVVEAEKELNPDEKITVVDDLPETADVVAAVKEQLEENHGEDGVELKTGAEVDLNFTEEQIANASVTTLDNGVGGEVALITLPVSEVAAKVKETLATEEPRSAGDINEEVSEELVADEASEMVDALAEDAEKEE